MLKGAFIGFGNVAANGHLPGWLARDDVRIVAATDAAAPRERPFSPPVPTAGGMRPSMICYRAKSSISSISARRRALTRR